MSLPKPSITVNVDATNPGQFFACCALLELASRLSASAEAWFTETQFHVANAPTDTITQFLEAGVLPVDDGDATQEGDDKSDSTVSKSTAVFLDAPFKLFLNWWREPEAVNARLKTWSAGQKVMDLFTGTTKHRKGKKGEKTTYSPSMRDHFRHVYEANPTDWLNATTVTDSPMPFCYDSRLCRKAALDGGHTSFGMLAFSPAIDVLVHVAFQRFRPRVIRPWVQNAFCTWRVPLGVSVAPAAVIGAVPHVVLEYYEFPIRRCDAAGKYKLFDHAQPSRRHHD
ncbi:MAG: hypothetical protein GXY38_14575 [Planctomycetes bacterium]|nr:hypothetical protein [Planctomycetota bacterium]